MRQTETQNEKAMKEIAQAHKKLSEPLKRHLKDVEELRIEEKNYTKVCVFLCRVTIAVDLAIQDKVTLQQTKDRVEEIDQSLKKLTWEHDVLLQKTKGVEAERDILFRKLEQTIYDVQQKSGFQQLLAEKKFEAASELLEVKDVALQEVVASANLAPEVFRCRANLAED